jgi:nanoRNase/pAp phosphatase (c-di-AMP/oligoRNAs hydrolase)
VATFDVADLGLDNINKFIAYAQDPGALYTVSVTRSSSRSKISLGSNPWRQGERKHNLAAMAERYHGGGHPAVAAISFPPDQLDEARAVAKKLADELRA